MSLSDQSSTLHPDIGRIAEGVELFNGVLNLMARMEDDGERERAWNYWRSRFEALNLEAAVPEEDWAMRA